MNKSNVKNPQNKDQEIANLKSEIKNLEKTISKLELLVGKLSNDKRELKARLEKRVAELERSFQLLQNEGTIHRFVGSLIHHGGDIMAPKEKVTNRYFKNAYDRAVEAGRTVNGKIPPWKEVKAEIIRQRRFHRIID